MFAKDSSVFVIVLALSSLLFLSGCGSTNSNAGNNSNSANNNSGSSSNPGAVSSSGSGGVGNQNATTYVYELRADSIAGFSVAKDGNLTPISGSPFSVPQQTKGISVSPTGNFLFEESGTTSADQIQQFIHAYKIDQSTGELAQAATTQGPSDLQLVAVHPSGKLLYMSGFDSGLFAYHIGDDGSLQQINSVPYPPKPAGVPTLSADGTLLYVASLAEGTNQIYGYAIDSATGTLTPVPGSPLTVGPSVVPGIGFKGPQGLTPFLDPAGPYLYVASQNDGNVDAFNVSAKTGALSPVAGSPIATHSMLPVSLASDPAGRFLYVGDYGNVNIAAFQINQSTGALAEVPNSPFKNLDTPIKEVATDTAGRFLYVDGSTSVTGYAIDQTSGALTPLPSSPFSTSHDPQPLGLVTVK